MLKKFYGNFSAVIFLVVVICGVGLFQFFRLPIALYPKTSRPKLNIAVSSSGLSTEDFKERYGNEVEAKILSLKEVEKVTGTYSSNGADWDVEFTWGYDEDKATTELKSILAGIESQFPREWGGFSINTRQDESNEVLFTIHSKILSEDDLYQVLDSKLSPLLQKVKGLDGAGVTRPFDHEIRITLDGTKLLQWGVYPGDLREVLQEKKEDLSLGRLDLKEGGKFNFYVPTKNRTVDDVAKTFIKRVGERDIYIRDVAQVTLKGTTAKRLYKGNGVRGVIVWASISPKSNIVQACDEVSVILKKNLRNFVSDGQFEELINPSIYVKEAVQNVEHEVLLGVLIATLVLFLFFGSLTYTTIIGVSIPLSLIGGFIVMNFLGIEINLISLGAMALSAGMVVDGAIVVLENIARHYEILNPKSLKEKIELTVQAVLEVREAVIVSLLTLIIVFAPLAFTSPLANAILGDLAKVMVCVLTISIGVSLLIIPPLFIALGRVQHVNDYFILSRWTIQFFDFFKEKYLRTLNWILGRVSVCWAFLGFCSLLFVGAACIFAFGLKKEIMAKPDTDKVWLTIQFPDANLEVEQIDARIIPYEEIIKKEFMPEMTHFFTNVNRFGAYILCNLKDKHNITQFKRKLEKRFRSTPFISFDVSPWLPSSLKIPEAPVVEIEIGGSLAKNDEERRQTLEKLYEAIDALDGVGQVNENPGHQLKYTYQLNTDLAMVRNFQNEYKDFTSNKIYDLVATHIKEQDVLFTYFDGEKIPIKMDFPKREWNGPQDISNLLLKIDENVIPARHFFKMVPERKWDSIYTVGGKKVVNLTAFAKESYLGKKENLKKIVMATINRLPIDRSSLSFLDTERDINDNILSLVLALSISLLLVWLLVNLQFANFSQSLIVMLVIPLGFIGASVALIVSNSPLSINSMLGLILLCGLAVNHSILFVDFYNAKREEGLAPFECILAAADLRFRPIMLTKLTTILGSMPIALGLGTGGEVLQALGITICGGLAISIPLTLFAVPISLHLRSRKGKV